METNVHLIVGMVLSCVVLIRLVAIVGGFLHFRRERLFTHTERIKALELGRSLPDDVASARIKAALGSSSNTEVNEENALSRKCYSTALWVAFWGFIAASNHTGSGLSTGVALAIAASTGVIGVTAVLCGAYLATRLPQPSPTHFNNYKTASEANAFDVVSSRG